MIESLKSVENLLKENLKKFKEELDKANNFEKEYREFIKNEEWLQIRNNQFNETMNRLKQVENKLKENITNKKQKISEEDKAMLF